MGGRPRCPGVSGWCWVFAPRKRGAARAPPACRRKLRPSLPPYINILEQTNLHCSEISRGGWRAPLGLAKRRWKEGRKRGGGSADPVSRCRFPLQITKRDLFFRTASRWERTLTTQNSFTNGLVLSFSSPGPQIALPSPRPIQTSRGAASSGGRWTADPGRRRPSEPGSQGSRAPGVSDQAEEKKMNIVTSGRI